MLSGTWKLVIPLAGGEKAELFSLERDLREDTNLAAQLPEKVGALRQSFEDWEKDIDRG